MYFKQKTEVIHIVVGAEQGESVSWPAHVSCLEVQENKDSDDEEDPRLPVNMLKSPLQVTHL
jgi:hypothetical protein